VNPVAPGWPGIPTPGLPGCPVDITQHTRFTADRSALLASAGELLKSLESQIRQRLLKQHSSSDIIMERRPNDCAKTEMFLNNVREIYLLLLTNRSTNRSKVRVIT